MEIVKRTKHLSSIFSYSKKVEISDQNLEIRPFDFTQVMGRKEIEKIQNLFPNNIFYKASDNKIQENKKFTYTVFTPKRPYKTGKAILLLHGLNEKSWDKYLTWAEYLCTATGKPVILFPIAFHMNRTPKCWSNARELMPWVEKRKHGNVNNSTFVNIALSYRLSNIPLRFYISGKESVYNVWQLFDEIKTGRHPLFREDTEIDIFSYSIGAFLSEVLLLANPDHLLDNSKLFMFCGGSVFSEMNINARDIVDNEACEKVRNYFLNDFIDKPFSDTYTDDFIDCAFKAMICTEYMKEYREAFFEKEQDRIKIATLKDDTVMTTEGVKKSIGKNNSILEEVHFPYKYTHQVPFPVINGTSPELLSEMFDNVFAKSADFLCG